MITWDNFYLFAVASICLWLTGAIFALRSSVRSRMAVVLTMQASPAWEYSLPGCGYLCNVPHPALWARPVYGTLSLWVLPGY